MPSRLRRLAELSPLDGLLLSQLLVGALAAALAVRLVPLPRLTAFVTRRAGRPRLRRLPLGHARYDLPRLARLADVAARAVRGERRCLVRSLLLLWLVAVRREPVALLLGVEREARTFRAHAWIEAGGRVVAHGAEAPGRYTTLVRLPAR